MMKSRNNHGFAAVAVFLVIISFSAWLYVPYIYFDTTEWKFEFKKIVVGVISSPQDGSSFARLKQEAKNYSQANGYEYREFDIPIPNGNKVNIRLIKSNCMITINDISSVELFSRYDINFDNIAFDTKINRQKVKAEADKFVTYLLDRRVIWIRKYVHNPTSNSVAKH